MTGADKAKALAQFIADTWSILDAPCTKATKNQALAFAEERADAHNPLRCVLVHSDAHAFNTLQQLDKQAHDGTTYKFIDPDGLFAEPAYDLAIPMREWSTELLAGDALRRGQEHCARLSALTGVDHRAIWQWGFMERVSTGLFLLQVGMTDLGTACLAVADHWSTAGTSNGI
jgi:streptomycin 6-kinase